ncbi:MAG: right-handed parallel beta-helix repeat-containing protein [Acidobacteriaceae bacterium]
MSHDSRNIPTGQTGQQPSRVLAVLATFICCGALATASAATLCVSQRKVPWCSTTIGAAVSAASPGDTILVAPGTYREEVIVTKSLSLVALIPNQVTINASGLSNGIFINGMAAMPNIGVSSVVVSGFTVKNANFEGILVANAYDTTLTGNDVIDNDKALSGGACPGLPAFETSEGDDCGEGIHLMADQHSSVVRNTVEHNAGGILISDETGVNRGNLVSGNVVQDNVYDCGITMASHPPAISIGPGPAISFGVSNNTISHNTSARNGVSGSGAGVGIFAAGPGTSNSGNVVIDNTLIGNGNAGVAMHNHGFAPSPAPGVNLNDNVIVGNHFSGNGADSGDAATPGTVGINIYSVAPITGTVVSQNTFDNEAIDVAFKATSGELSVHLNNFERGAIGVDNLGTAPINATEDWWGCLTGPGSRGCAKASGPSVSTIPWLISPFQTDSN